jgi:uncharacterized protein
MDYPIKPVAFTDVRFEDNFWKVRLEANRDVTIPTNFKRCEETGRIDNFVKAAGKMAGAHTGLFFNDSDVFKVIEGASYSLSLYPDAGLESYLDDLIAKIADAQEDDGYLYTARTINPSAVTAEKEGLTRWSNLKVNHELYNLGHMYEAAVAHYQATGKKTFLNVALKSADLVDSVFGKDKKRDVPGHQEIEMGLVKLYRVTGKERYLKLAKFFLDERGHHENGRQVYGWPDNLGYAQDHEPVTEQKEAVGHAVRAVYMYAGMADVAALTGNQNYIKALDALWENVVAEKIYLTGGLGARHHGEAFGDNYELPNATAYNETCAAIASMFWNHRMFLLHGDAKYIDVLERTLYNGFLSGISLQGDSFFYANPLESDGHWPFNVKVGATRSPWFECSCCPPNVARLFPSIPGYVYAQKDDVLYVNLYGSSTGKVALSQVALSQVTMQQGNVTLQQETNYPWDGSIKLIVNPEQEAEFTLALRIPGWAQGEVVPSDLYTYLEQSYESPTVSVNGGATSPKLKQGYIHIKRQWQRGDTVELNLPMPVRRVVSHKNVKDNVGKVAVERGPIVYCAEAVDNEGKALNSALKDTSRLTATRDEDLLGGVTVIQGNGLALIPYYAWSHRGEGEMVVWLERQS